MKIISRKEKVYDYYVDKYELNGIYVGRTGYRPGLLVCYLLATLPKTDLQSFFADEEGELGGLRNLINLTTEEFKKKYQNIDVFMKDMISNDIQSWEMSVEYNRTPLKITGNAWYVNIGIVYPVNRTINLLPLLVEIEDLSFQIHEYNDAFVEQVKVLFELNQKNAIRNLNKMKKHLDIFEEFKSGCRNFMFTFSDNLVKVLGYDAKMLYTQYPLSQLGAYNFLIYLRENPDEALEDLKNGLPGK